MAGVLMGVCTGGATFIRIHSFRVRMLNVGIPAYPAIAFFPGRATRRRRPGARERVGLLCGRRPCYCHHSCVSP